MAKHRTSRPVCCEVCGRKISRKADLPRHMKTHALNKEELMYSCPYVGCPFKTLQQSNLKTHLNVHTGERPNKCPVEGCDFSCADPGSLCRHKKEIHGYEPKEDSRSSGTGKASRRLRRVSPYTSSLTSCSSSPSPTSLSDASFDTFNFHCNSFPRFRTKLDLSPSSFVSCDCCIKEGNKSSSVAFGTDLTTREQEVIDSQLVPNHVQRPPPVVAGLSVTPKVDWLFPEPEPQQDSYFGVDMPAHQVSEMASEVFSGTFDEFLAHFNDVHCNDAVLPLVSLPATYDSSTAPETHKVEYPPQPERRNHYGVSFLPQSVSETALGSSHAAFDHLLGQFNGSKAHSSVPPPVSTSILPMASHPHLDPSSFPPYMNLYTLVASHPSPVDFNVTSQANFNVGNSANVNVGNNATYKHCGYNLGTIPLDAQLSRPCSFIAQGMMHTYPQIVDQTYSTSTATVGSCLPMRGPCVY